MRNFKPFAVFGAVLSLTACAPTQQSTGQILAQAVTQNSVAQSAVNAGAVTNAGSESGLVNVLVDQLGINSQQAMGGAGSIFSLARQRMSPADFMQLSGSVSDMDQYLFAVPQSSGSSSISWLGSAADLMGDQANGLGSLATLAGSFKTLGMDTNMISQFVPVVLEYVQGQSGPGVMSLLQSALY